MSETRSEPKRYIAWLKWQGLNHYLLWRWATEDESRVEVRDGRLLVFSCQDRARLAAASLRLEMEHEEATPHDVDAARAWLESGAAVSDANMLLDIWNIADDIRDSLHSPPPRHRGRRTYCRLFEMADIPSLEDYRPPYKPTWGAKKTTRLRRHITEAVAAIEAALGDAVIDADQPQFRLDWEGEGPGEVLISFGEWLERIDSERAFEFYTAAQRINPASPLPFSRAARLALKSGDAARAIQLLEQSLTAYPSHAVTLQLLARIYLENGEPEPALRHIGSALACAPLSGGAWLLRLRILAALGRWSEILGATPHPGDEAYEARMFRVLALAQVGQMEEATELWSRIPKGPRQRHQGLTAEIRAALGEGVGRIGRSV